MRLKARKKVNILCSQDINEILADILKEKNHCTPQINIGTGNNITSIKFNFSDLDCSIIPNVPDENDMSISIHKNMYKIVKEYDSIIYSWLLNKNNLSSNSDETQRIIEELPVGPICGYFDNKPKEYTYNAIDDIKAYTSKLYNIKYLPVFKMFDDYKIYDDYYRIQ